MERYKQPLISPSAASCSRGVPTADCLSTPTQCKQQTMAGEFQMKMGMVMKMILRKPKLLIVDDEPQICRLMERCLKEHFDEIITTTDPIKAHAILEEQKITHVLSDLQLGGEIDGITFLSLLRREFPFIECAVIFTGADTHRLKPPVEIDAVVSKREGMNAIIDALLGKIR